jgi:hypothetical protein
MRVATFPLRSRRTIGVLVLTAGVLIVVLGFFVDLSAGIDPSHQLTIGRNQSASIPVGSGVTAGSTLRHALDHGLAGITRTASIADFGFRTGVIFMAIGGGIAALTLLAPPLRGFAGLGAGIGLLGDALVAGVLVGERSRLTVAATPSLHVDISAGVVVLALGFAVILVGGALAAFRPLAGLVSGISLAFTGAALGAGLALIVGGDRVVALIRGVHIEV